MKLKKLFTKIFLSYLLIIVVTIVILLLFSFSSVRDHDLNVSKNYLLNFTRIISKTIEKDLNNKNYPDIKNYIDMISGDSKIRITIIAPKGEVIADTEENPVKMDNHNFRSEIIRSRNSDYGTSVRFSNTLDKNMVYVAKQIRNGDNLYGYVRTSYFRSELNSIFQQIKNNLILFSIIIVVFLFTVSYIFSRRLTRPINKIIEAAQEVTSGNMNVKLFSKKKDEIGNLVQNFNEMIQRLKNSITEIKNREYEIHSIVEAFSEALWVIDSNYKIQIYNKSFLKFTNTDECKNKPYKEVINNLNLIVLINKVFGDNRKTFSQEIELDNRTYYISTSKIEHNNNIVFLLSDITELRKVKIMKKDFVANASHELKTPLTSIKGFVETLEDDITEENHLYYLSIIKRNIDRLINISKDIMTLNFLETKQSLEIDTVNLLEIIENVKQSLHTKLEEKNITLVIEADESELIEGDSYLIEQVVHNLIINAIKYSQSERIVVKLEFDENNCYLSVIDFGIGIPEDKIPRLFERFFVVDSSHSRKIGGTGLGLSIVKHIANLHNGKIFVESEVDKGTTFRILLPKYYENY